MSESVNDFLAAEQTYTMRRTDPDYWFEVATIRDEEAAEEAAYRQERGRR